MIHTRWLRVSFALCLILSLPLVTSSADHKTITIVTGQQKLSPLRAWDQTGVLYVALNDFAVALNLSVFANDSVRKFEVRLASHRLKVTAHNPFVVITELSSNTASVSQLTQEVFYRDSLYYVPVSSFVQMYARLATVRVSFDQKSSTIALTSQPPSSTFDITGVDIEPRLNGYLLTIKASRKLTDVETWHKEDGWLFVTIPDVTADLTALRRVQPYGAIREILVFPSPTSIQLTFRVAPDVVPPPEIIDDTSSYNIMISLRTRSEIEKAELEKKRQEFLRKNLESARERWKLDVIVIDAGHGGKDPGTIGVGGTREKDVTLSIALKLGNLIEKNMKDVKVVYTRKTNTFVELYRRTQIANEAGGKLFLSIHCNSTERKPSGANGFEIYLLRPGKEEHALKIAERENSVIQFEENYEQRYKKLTEEEFIILSMAQSAFVKHSERFAEISSDVMAQRLRMKNSGVKQAGFYVLVGASMPNALIETGYLSNRAEEKLLRSSEGQQKMAQSLFEGIKQYKAIYEQTLEEGRTFNGRQ